MFTGNSESVQSSPRFAHGILSTDELLARLPG
jgi:hypothetical protein